MVVAFYAFIHLFIFRSRSFGFPARFPPAALIPPFKDLYIVFDLSIHSTGLLFSRG